jgi:hypothetical protein
MAEELSPVEEKLKIAADQLAGDISNAPTADEESANFDVIMRRGRRRVGIADSVNFGLAYLFSTIVTLFAGVYHSYHRNPKPTKKDTKGS